MQEVTELRHLKENIAELERGRNSVVGHDAEEFRLLIKRGTCFVPYMSQDRLAFAPSRFVGYIGNSLRTHADNQNRHGKDTNAALSRLLGSHPYVNAFFEKSYLDYCASVGVIPSASGSFGKPRKYWITQEIIELLERSAETDIEKNPDISETKKQQLIKARVGQGLFRGRLISYWGKCCLTGCDIHEILRASHIKPWRESNNAERLDVFNGLLLSPNMDALFDKGLISFEDSGDILVSPQMSAEAQKALGCKSKMKITVEPEHVKYIAWHRQNLFLSAA